MSIFLKESTSIDVRIGPFVDVGDGFTPETAVTLTGGGDNADEAELLKANGAATVDISSNTWTAVTNCDGWYDLTLTATDTNTIGELIVVIQNDSVHLPVHQRFYVIETAIYDALFASAAAGFDTNGRVDVGSWLGTAVTTSATSAKPEVDTFSISDDSTAANNAELDYDGTGYNKSNSTIGTCTTNTDMRGTDSASTHAAADVWAVDATTQQTQGTFGQAIGDPVDDTNTIYGRLDADVSSRLAPTTAGRTLDVTVGGTAGIDWANVESPSTAVDLSATDINLVDTCTTNTDMRGTDSALLASSAPTNFSDLAITVTAGEVTVGTNNDKTGYSISGTKTTLDALNDLAQSDILSDATAFAGGNIDAAVSTRATPAQVNTQVLDVMNTDTFAEPGQETPASTTTLVNKIGYLYKFLRNRVTATSTTISVYNDDAVTVDQKSSHSDDGITYDRGEFATGP